MIRHDFKKSILPGLIAGPLAGVLMLLVLSFGGYIDGNSIWEPTARIAGVWFGNQTLSLAPQFLFAGILTHLSISTLLGVVFGLLTKRISGTSTEIVAGMFFAALVWSIGTYVFLPVLDSLLYSFAVVEQGFWFFSHMVYGFSLGSCAPLKRWLGNKIQTLGRSEIQV